MFIRNSERHTLLEVYLQGALISDFEQKTSPTLTHFYL